MYIPRVGWSPVCLLLATLFLAAWNASTSLAAESRLLVIPPFKEHPQAPALRAGLQQVLIDDLHGLFPNRVMAREEMRALLLTSPGERRATLYRSDIPRRSSQLQTRFVLLNDLRDRQGAVTWRVQLLRGTTGASVQEWTFTGSLDRIWSLKEQVLAAVVSHLPQAERQGAMPTATAVRADEARLASLAAFTRGLEALEQRDYCRALQEWRYALSYDATFRSASRQLESLRAWLPTANLPLREQGLCLLADARHEQAEGVLQEAVRYHAQDGAVWRALGEIALERKNLKLARQYASKAREVDPEQALTWLLLGQVAQAEGKEREASEMLQKARVLDPLQAAVLEQLAAVATRLRAVEQAYAAHVQAGELYTALLRLPEAQRQVAAARQLVPQSAAPLLAEGALWQRLGQPREALTRYTQARALEPGNAAVAHRIGTVWRQLGDTQAAVEHYQQALSLASDDVDSQVHLGEIRLEARDYANAALHLEKAGKLQPTRLDVKRLLAQTYVGMGKKDVAVQAYRALVQAGTEEAETYQAYGDALLARGKVAEAAQQYAQAVRLDPDAATAYERLGKVQEKLGQTAASAATLAQMRVLHAAAASPQAARPAPETSPASIVQLIEALPPLQWFGGPVHVAAIDLDTSVDRPTGLGRAWSWLQGLFSLKTTDLTGIKAEFEQALQHHYPLIPRASLEKVFRGKTYQDMRDEHLGDVPYLTALCEMLSVQALTFYRVSQEARPESAMAAITVRATLFVKDKKALWTKTAQFDVPREHITWLHVPSVVLWVGGGVALLGYVCVYLLQGFGSLVVQIQQGSREKKAFFSVIVSTHGQKDLTRTKQSLRQEVKSAARGGKYEREVHHGFYEHSMVFNETTFPRLHVGTYYVYLCGVIVDRLGEDIGNYQMTQKVAITRHGKHQVVFDLRPKTSRVRVQVLHGTAVAKGAEVAIRGQSESRYIKDELGVLFELPVGMYTFVIQYEGILFTQEAEIGTVEKGTRLTFSVPSKPLLEAADMV